MGRADPANLFFKLTLFTPHAKKTGLYYSPVFRCIDQPSLGDAAIYDR